MTHIALVTIAAVIVSRSDGSRGSDDQRWCAYTQNHVQMSRVGPIKISKGNSSGNSGDATGVIFPNDTQLCAPTVSSCFALWFADVNNTVLLQGCWDPGEDDYCGSVCVGQGASETSTLPRKTRFCCCHGNYCNNNMTDAGFAQPHTTAAAVVNGPSGVDYDPNYALRTLIATILVLMFGILVVVGIFVLLKCFCRRAYKHTPSPASGFQLIGAHVDASVGTDGGGHELEGLTLDVLVSGGRYSDVHRGRYRGNSVAVKMFSASQCQYYVSERDVYRLPFMNQHSSFAKFYFAAEQEYEGPRRYYVVLAYQELGTLTGYLKQHTVDWVVLCRMCTSIASGLSHLHAEIVRGDKLKPAVAHRDLNSRNILVRDDLGCVLVDFGFAMQIDGSRIVRDGVEQSVEQSSLTDVGTRRYMAPEILEGAVNLRDCESSLKQIDVYAVGLLFWEIGCRCSDMFQGLPVPEYQLPFQAELGVNPTFDDMQQLVAKNKQRPLFPNQWKDSNPAIRAFKETIEDCWDQDGDARLTAMCVHERCVEVEALWARQKGVVQVPTNTNFESHPPPAPPEKRPELCNTQNTLQCKTQQCAQCHQCNSSAVQPSHACTMHCGAECNAQCNTTYQDQCYYRGREVQCNRAAGVHCTGQCNPQCNQQCTHRCALEGTSYHTDPAHSASNGAGNTMGTDSQQPQNTQNTGPQHVASAGVPSVVVESTGTECASCSSHNQQRQRATYLQEPSRVDERLQSSATTDTLLSTLENTRPPNVSYPPTSVYFTRHLKKPMYAHQGENPTQARNTHKASDEELKVRDNALVRDRGSSGEVRGQARSGEGGEESDHLLQAMNIPLPSSRYHHQHYASPIPYMQNDVASEPIVTRPKQPNLPPPKPKFVAFFDRLVAATSLRRIFGGGRSSSTNSNSAKRESATVPLFSSPSPIAGLTSGFEFSSPAAITPGREGSAGVVGYSPGASLQPDVPANALQVARGIERETNQVGASNRMLTVPVATASSMGAPGMGTDGGANAGYNPQPFTATVVVPSWRGASMDGSNQSNSNSLPTNIINNVQQQQQNTNVRLRNGQNTTCACPTSVNYMSSNGNAGNSAVERNPPASAVLNSDPSQNGDLTSEHRTITGVNGGAIINNKISSATAETIMLHEMDDNSSDSDGSGKRRVAPQNAETGNTATTSGIEEGASSDSPSCTSRSASRNGSASSDDGVASYTGSNGSGRISGSTKSGSAFSGGSGSRAKRPDSLGLTPTASVTRTAKEKAANGALTRAIVAPSGRGGAKAIPGRGFASAKRAEVDKITAWLGDNPV